MRKGLDRGAAAVERTSGWRLALAGLLTFVLVAACNPNVDASLYVSNHTGATWYLAVDSKDGMHFVSKVDDGAEGFALVWESHGDRTVTVLDTSCKAVGTLQVQSDGSFMIPAVPGLTATIKATGKTDAYADGVEHTHDCGGDSYM